MLLSSITLKKEAGGSSKSLVPVYQTTQFFSYRAYVNTQKCVKFAIILYLISWTPDCTIQTHKTSWTLIFNFPILSSSNARNAKRDWKYAVSKTPFLKHSPQGPIRTPPPTPAHRCEATRQVWDQERLRRKYSSTHFYWPQSPSRKINSHLLYAKVEAVQTSTVGRLWTARSGIRRLTPSKKQKLASCAKGIEGQGVRLTFHLELWQMLRYSATVASLSHTCARCGA